MYKNFLVPIDLAHESSWRQSMPIAVEFIRQFGGQMHVMTVIPEIDLGLVAVHFPKDFERKKGQEAKQRLDGLLKEQVPDDIPVNKIIAHGTIYKEILRVGSDIKADLIIMASHRPEMKDFLLGANAAKVVSHATCSVLVIRE